MATTFDSKKTCGTEGTTYALWETYNKTTGTITVSNLLDIYYPPYAFTDVYRTTNSRVSTPCISDGLNTYPTAYISNGLYAYPNSGSVGIVINGINVTGTIDFTLPQSNAIYTISNDGYLNYSSSPDLRKYRLKSNLIIQRKSRADTTSLNNNLSENEKVALETLREIISETEFRKYLKYGFILVKGKSGDTYQIFKNRSHTKIWRGGKLIEEICIRIKDIGIPYTDNVIAFKTMIETDEQDFKSCGNIYKFQRAA